MIALGYEVKLCLVYNLYFMLIGISLISLELGREIKLKGNVPDLIAQSAVGHACVCVSTCACNSPLKIPAVVFLDFFF